MDPTLNEMLEALQLVTDADATECVDCQMAAYWFAADYHGGQSSNLYSALSTSPYTPSPSESGPSDVASFLYGTLVSEFS